VVGEELHTTALERSLSVYVRGYPFGPDVTRAAHVEGQVVLQVCPGEKQFLSRPNRLNEFVLVDELRGGDRDFVNYATAKVLR
jgi:hypothetical protein